MEDLWRRCLLLKMKTIASTTPTTTANKLARTIPTYSPMEVVTEEEELQMFAPGVQTPLPLHVSLMVHGFESLHGFPFGRGTNEQPTVGLQDGFFWHELGVHTTDGPVQFKFEHVAF